MRSVHINNLINIAKIYILKKSAHERKLQNEQLWIKSMSPLFHVHEKRRYFWNTYINVFFHSYKYPISHNTIPKFFINFQQ